MSEISKKDKIYDLEERTFQFAKSVRILVKDLPKTIANIKDIKQLIRSSASIGSNYIEANESLSKKDFKMRVKISRKEAKESAFFIRLIKETNDPAWSNESSKLYNEAIELKKILSTIINKSY